MKRQSWSQSIPNKRLLSMLPGPDVRALEDKIRQGLVVMRMNGGTHLEFKSAKDHSLKESFTVGSTQGAPVYAKKLRTFLRRLDT